MDCRVTTFILIFFNIFDLSVDAKAGETLSRNITLCDGEIGKLACPRYSKIKLLSSFWGRSDKKTCPSWRTFDKTCSSDTVFGQTQTLCNGLEICLMAPSTSLFGNPCFLTLKYFRATYTCLKKAQTTSSPQHTERSTSQTMFANTTESWSTTSPLTTKYGTEETDTLKSKPKSLAVTTTTWTTADVKTNTRTTTSTVSTLSSRLSLPTAESQSTRVACENEKVVVTCHASTRFDVVKAVFGRSDSTTCTNRKTNHHIKTNCKRNVIKYFQLVCNGKRKCELEATNYLFGDPCPGTSKYLTVTYICKR